MSALLGALGTAIKAVSRFWLAPIDARVYALVRVSLGLLASAVVAETWPVRAALYTAEGMTAPQPSLYLYLPLAHGHDLRTVTITLGLAGIAAVCLTLGLCTRVALLYTWAWSMGASIVALPAETGYDAIVRIASFVLLWSPMQRAWSLDSRLFGPGPRTLPRYGLRLLQWQLLILYAVTVWLKAPDVYWRNGEFMAFFMMSLFSRARDPVWAELGRTSALLTWGALAIEAAVPVLLCTRFRRVAMALGFALHAGIALGSRIELFSFAMLPLYASFVTGDDLDALGRLGGALRRRVPGLRARQETP
jgi:Vitamin K-dependent gamma-carboxylase